MLNRLQILHGPEFKAKVVATDTCTPKGVRVGQEVLCQPLGINSVRITHSNGTVSEVGDCVFRQLYEVVPSRIHVALAP